jgi:hypothetical protein
LVENGEQQRIFYIKAYIPESGIFCGTKNISKKCREKSFVLCPMFLKNPHDFM